MLLAPRFAGLAPRAHAFQTTGPRERESGASPVDLGVKAQLEADKFQSAPEKAVMKALEKALGSELSHGPMVPKPQPSIVVISGPSGVGKDAVIKELQRRREDLHFVVTSTSRGMREGEVDGVDYVFTTSEDFEDMIARGELLEHAIVYGEYKGIPKQQVRDALDRGTDVVLRLDVQGAATIRKMCPEAVLIFMVAESEYALVRRLVSRKTEQMDKLKIRVQTAREECKLVKDFDYVVVNADNQLDHAVDELCTIIDAQKLQARPPKIEL